jgi:dienelactone hydrolase
VTVRLDLFAYDDVSASLRFAVSAREERDGLVVEELRYDDGAGGAAQALVVRPLERDAAAGVVIAHGGFEGGKHLFLDQAVELAAEGFVALAADTVFPRSGSAAAVEAAVRASVLTHRRSLDVLEASYRVVRLGFFGHSRGGKEGAIVAAVEPRLDAVVVAGMGSAAPERRRAAATEAEREYLDAVFSFDTAAYLAVPGRRRLLVQHGRRDDRVLLGEARAMFDAARPPKLWREYDCGHDVSSDPAARRDRIAFFHDSLAVSDGRSGGRAGELRARRRPR